MRIFYNENSINLSTGIWLPENEWVAKKSKVKGNSAKAYSLNKQLQDMEEHIYQVVTEIQLAGEVLSLEAIKMKFRNGDKKLTLLSLFDYHIQDIKNHIKNGSFSEKTLQHYEVSKKKLVEFLKQPPYKCSDIDLKRLDGDFINRFDNFITVTYGNSVNTVSNNIKKLKAVINTGIKIGWLMQSPFTTYKGKTEKPNKQPLTMEELSTLESLDLSANERLSITRDIFMFGAYTGMSYIDMRNITQDNIVTSLSGTFIKYNRTKTEIPAVVPYFEPARKIVEKYRGHILCIERGTLLPVITNEALNRNLKDLGKLANLSKKLTVHLSRTTFATNALEAGVSLISISRSLGHSSIKITASHYAKVTDKQINDSFKSFGTILNNPEENKVFEAAM